MKILLIQTASIGDVILATPVLEELHQAYPSAEIDFLIKKGIEGLFNGHPFICQLIVWDKKNKFKNFLRILGKVRKTKYDLVINIQRFALTGILTAFSGAGRTVGFRKNPFSILFSERMKHHIEQGIHEVERNLSLIQALLPPAQKAKASVRTPKPRLYPSAADEARVLTFKMHRFICISPASLWFTKQFPVIKWVELIRSMPDGIFVYLLGSSADIPLCQEIVIQSGRENLQILAGDLSFLESAALMSDAMMNYTNDSAPMHLASAVNAPAAAVYCSTIPEFGFGPLSEKQWIIQSRKKLPCRPCGLHGKKECPLGHFECAMTINVNQFPPLS
ncbi:MAG: glycosyltransferase family 9 protein [Bacteroidales bacterium]